MLLDLIRQEGIDKLWFSYSGVSHQYDMEKGSAVTADSAPQWNGSNQFYIDLDTMCIYAIRI